MEADTVVCYLSKYGTTRRYAEIIANETNGAIVDLKKVKGEDLASAAKIVIGGPIFAGKAPGALAKFCEKHKTLLLKKDVSLYITCMEQGENGMLQLERAYPDWLLVHAKQKKNLGGEIILSRLSGFYKFIITKMMKQSEDKSFYNEADAKEFALSC